MGDKIHNIGITTDYVRPSGGIYKNPAWLLLYYKKEIGSDGSAHIFSWYGCI